jgi:hypothetical protein
MRFAWRTAMGVACAVAWLGASVPAAASGPVERIVQVMPKPGKPDSLVVRYGVASNGFLYSEDGGKKFAATCVSAVAPELAKTFDRLNKISLNPIASTAAVTMDGAGRVMFSQYGSMWMNDGTGCKWERLANFDGKWAFSIKTDPADPGVVWAAVATTVEEGTAEARSDVELWRRNAQGTWETAGAIVKLAPGNILYDGDLLVSVKDGKTRVYATLRAGGATLTQHVTSSDDGGKTWTNTRLSGEFDALNLIAVDPTNPDRLLGALSRDGGPDRLLISTDRGVTFKDYLNGLRAISGATFDPTGRVFIGDVGDATSEDTVGGLYTAAKLGDPLTKIAGTQTIDCVHHDAQTGKLYVCQAEKFGVADPTTGKVTNLVSINTVPEILTCPGRDMVEECKEQLNEGPSWCCAGHFPFTPFCGQYDVTQTASGRRVFCGKSGREYDSPPDAGAPESLSLEHASVGEERRASADDGVEARATTQGCALQPGADDRENALGLLLSGLSVLLVMMRRARRRP